MDVNAIISGIETADVLITALAGSAIVSETLPFVGRVKSNSTLQLCFNIIKAVLAVFKKY